MNDREYYDAIFKRRSFHLFKECGGLNEEDLSSILEFADSLTPLYPDIRTKIKIVRESETACSRGAEYCIMFYSEKKDGYLNNIGYIGEQVDLYLAHHDIASLWFGIGTSKEKDFGDLSFVIKIAISKTEAGRFRKDMFKAKRKPIKEIWSGDTMNIADIVRFSPSSCNTQPWIVENDGTA